MKETPRATRVLWLAGGLCALAVWIILWQSGSRSATQVAAQPFWQRENELEAATAMAAPNFEDSRIDAAPTDTAAAVDAGLQNVVPSKLTITGRVIDVQANGVVGAKVAIERATSPNAKVEGTTDARGCFELELSRETWRLGDVHAAVITGSAGERLFRGAVQLEPELTLLVPEALVLHGQLATDPPRSLSDTTVAIYVPAAGRFATNLYVGRAPLEADGHFTVTAALPAPSESLLLWFGASGSLLKVATEPLSALVSEFGAHILAHTRTVRLSIGDAAGQPLQSALVAIGILDPRAGTLPTVRASSGADGGVDLIVPDGSIEVCVAKIGYAPALFRLTSGETLGGQRLEVHLDALETVEALTGVVLDPVGAPLEGARVSLFPHGLTEAVSVAHSAVTSGLDGRFSIPAPRATQIDVVAHHKDFGLSQRLRLGVGERQATIRFEFPRRLVIHVRGGILEPWTRSGTIQWFLADRQRENVLHGHVWTSPIEIEQAPEGNYNLLVFWEGKDAWGEIPVSVDQRGSAEFDIWLQPASWLTGVVIDDIETPVVGATVELRAPSWPAEAIDAWGCGRSDSNGEFRVLVGSAQTADIDVCPHGDGSVSTRWSGPVWSGARIVVPSR